MMKVTLTQQGGMVVGLRRPTKTIDTAALPPAKAEQLSRLIAALKGAPPQGAVRSTAARDAITYTIKLDEADGTTMLARESDGAMSEQFAALLEWLERS